MKYILILGICFCASTLFAQSKKEQIVILNFRLDSAQREYVKDTAQLGHVVKKLEKEILVLKNKNDAAQEQIKKKSQAIRDKTETIITLNASNLELMQERKQLQKEINILKDSLNRNHVPNNARSLEKFTKYKFGGWSFELPGIVEIIKNSDADWDQRILIKIKGTSFRMFINSEGLPGGCVDYPRACVEGNYNEFIAAGNKFGNVDASFINDNAWSVSGVLYANRVNENIRLHDQGLFTVYEIGPLTSNLIYHHKSIFDMDRYGISWNTIDYDSKDASTFSPLINRILESINFQSNYYQDFEKCNLSDFTYSGGRINVSNASYAYKSSCGLSMEHYRGDESINFYPKERDFHFGTYNVKAVASSFISDNILHLFQGDELKGGITFSFGPKGGDTPGLRINGLGIDYEDEVGRFDINQWYDIKIEYFPSHLKVFVNDYVVYRTDSFDLLTNPGRFKLGVTYAGLYDNLNFIPYVSD
jgi:hypothetical protein